MVLNGVHKIKNNKYLLKFYIIHRRYEIKIVMIYGIEKLQKKN